MHSKRKVRQAGNVFLVLFGAVAAAGVLTAGVGGIMRGPLNSAWTVHRQNMAETQLAISAKVATRAAVTQPSAGDCDGDGFIEPLPYVDAGTGPKPAGGGYVPASMGVPTKDPWNRNYGYCAFDHGSAVNAAGCGGAGQLRRAGTGISKWEALALISAGPDGVFQTSCNDWVDANVDGAPDTPMVNKPTTSDDSVFTWTYEEAVAASGGLWNPKTSSPTTAEIDKNISVKNAGVEQMNFDTTSKALTLGAGSTGAVPTIKTDSIGPVTTNWVQTTSGQVSRCALKSDYSAWCWGANFNGQLGQGNTTASNIPVQVSAGSFWKNISTSYQGHTCGVKTNGTLWCWGRNNYGQIGDGSTTQRNSPVQIGVATDWKEVKTLNYNSCALRTDGTLWCWGWGGNNGDGTATQRNSPVQAGVATDWVKLSGGGAHACAIKAAGTLWCWGQNDNGYLGDGTTTARQSPTQVGVGTDWASISAGNFFTCGIKTAGTLWCWGVNTYNSLGDGTTTQRTSPVQIGVATNWSVVAAGGDGGSAVKTDGTLWGWGRNNWSQIGDGTSTQRANPVQVGAVTTWSRVSAGGGACAIRSNGTLWCWGINSSGDVGDGTVTPRTSPVQLPGGGTGLVGKIGLANNVNAAGKYMVNGTDVIDATGNFVSGEQDPTIGDIQDGKFCSVNALPEWTKVSASYKHSCAIKSNGTMWCWGENGGGELGDGTTTDRSTPVQVGSATDWLDVSVGFETSCGRKSNGTLWCWGRNDYAQMGDGTTTNRPAPVQIGAGAADWAKIKMSFLGGCAIKNSGTLWCWGRNNYGQVGDGSTTQRTLPVQIGVSTQWADLAGGLEHTCGVMTDGRLWCWGRNNNGQVGDGTTTQRTSPTQILAGPNTWSEVEAGREHTCGLKNDGTLRCWGLNDRGQLGDATNTARTSPVQIGVATDWAKIMTGGNHTCGKKSNGTLWCWGWNMSWQLGDGSMTDRNAPVQVLSGATDISDSITGGDIHTCATRTDNSIWCWGYNAEGQSSGPLGLNMTPVNINASFPSFEPKITCTSEPPSSSGVLQNGITPTATENAGCSTLGELRKDVSGNLLVCDDNATSALDAGFGSCIGFEPGALTFNKNMAMFYCGDNTAAPSDCTLDGKTVAHGGSDVFYNTNLHANCASVSETRNCNNGVLDGTPSYNKATCTVPLNCTLDGKTVTHGNSDWFYNIAVHTNCASRRISRTCTNGVLDGSATYQYANCAAPANCTLDGQTVFSGSSYTFYTTTSAPNCATVSQSRLCTNGTFNGSGSYNRASCTNQPSCTLDGVTVYNGDSYTFYTTYSHSNCASVGQSRTCNSGTLSGSGSYNKGYCFAPDPCLSGPIGTTCYDGAIYIGNPGMWRVYAYPSDAGTYTYQGSMIALGTTDATGGYSNSNLLIGSGESVPAASACTFGMSYLPSTNELGLIWTNRAYLSGLNTTAGVASYYWTSTETAANTASMRRFDTGATGNASKAATYNVRCVRQ